MILAVPVNQFLHQEPASNADIKAFAAAHGCPDSKTFFMLAKSTANSPVCTAKESDCTPTSKECCAANNPLYALLRGALPGRLDWNFAVFLVNKAGVPVSRL